MPQYYPTNRKRELEFLYTNFRVTGKDLSQRVGTSSLSVHLGKSAGLLTSDP